MAVVAEMERYAGLVPEALEELSPKERHQVYRMLHLKVVAHLDATLEVSETFSGAEFGKKDLLRTRESQNTQPLGLRFRASLIEGGDRRVQLHSV
jgi:hypothetical protein